MIELTVIPATLLRKARAVLFSIKLLRLYGNGWTRACIKGMLLSHGRRVRLYP